MSLPTDRQDDDVIENEDINAIASEVNRVSEALASGGGTSGPGAVIQVGGAQPASGWWLDNGAVAPDRTAPTTPTGLTATATGGSTVSLSWSAATDNIGVTGYNYRIGTGAAVNAGAGTTETVTGLTALTSYSFQVQAYDAQGNVSGWSTAANVTTLAGPDTTAPTPGTLAASAVTQNAFTLTVSGASDAVGLHATPYAFSTDNGATWSAWQAGATYNVTGKTASTGYQARHKVRDAAGNEATGTAITVTTAAPAPVVFDDFNRADGTAGGQLGTATSGQAWTDPSSAFRVSGNKATLHAGQGGSVIAYLDAGAHNVEVGADISFATSGNGSASVWIGTAADVGYFLELRHPSQGARAFAVAKNVPGGLNASLTNTNLAYTASDVVPVQLRVVESGATSNIRIIVAGTALYDSAFSNGARDKTGTFVGVASSGTATSNFIDNLTVTTI